MENKSKFFKQVADIVSEKCNIAIEEITASTSFQNDLSLNSLQLVESIVEVEERFDVEIPDNQLFKINTVGDLVNFLENNA
ncbi:MAG: acyl carrier protein [Rikenellaceae bacterium]